jgi:hypothetical protein
MVSSLERRDEIATNVVDESLVLGGLSGRTSSKMERGSKHDPRWQLF